MLHSANSKHTNDYFRQYLDSPTQVILYGKRFESTTTQLCSLGLSTIFLSLISGASYFSVILTSYKHTSLLFTLGFVEWLVQLNLRAFHSKYSTTGKDQTTTPGTPCPTLYDKSVGSFTSPSDHNSEDAGYSLILLFKTCAKYGPIHFSRII